MEKKHHNLSAYQSYEIFDDPEELRKYRQSKLESCDKHVQFLKNEFKFQKIKVLELGSGNSKLLINLNNHNLLEIGYGIEISKNRFNFAENWISDLNFSNIKNINSDLIQFKYDTLFDLDVCICVDLCFQFLVPIQQGSDEIVLKRIYDILKVGGKIILELDYCGNIINNLPYTNKIWEEFPETDPYKYSLWNCEYNKLSRILEWEKTFISKKNEFEKTSISLRIYDRNEIWKLLNKIGFKNIIFYKDWESSNFEKNFGEFIVVAEK
jgi:SAM-dependent methyltransferase